MRSGGMRKARHTHSADKAEPAAESRRRTQGLVYWGFAQSERTRRGGRTGRHLGGCGAAAIRATPPPERAGHLDAPPPKAPAVRGARSPTPPQPGAYRRSGASAIRAAPSSGRAGHLGRIASQRLLNPGHAATWASCSPEHPLPKASATRGTPLPGAIAPRRPSNTGSTPRSFPRCSPCRGRPGSPACRRCGTAGSRSAP